MEMYREFKYEKREGYLPPGTIDKEDKEKRLSEDDLNKYFEDFFTPAVHLRIIYQIIKDNILVDLHEVDKICPDLNH